jgi:hypothetical protein
MAADIRLSPVLFSFGLFIVSFCFIQNSSMTSTTIARLRLLNQQLAAPRFKQPEQLVQWMGCIQAQDFAGAKWALGNRLPGITEAAIDQLFNEGKILRTHILRPTWHLVSPADIGWMLQLTAPRIKAFNKVLHRKLGIDDRVLTRSKHVMVKALTGGRQLTREQLVGLLQKARINTDDIRSNFLLMDAELDGIICSGARQGKQFTYALLEERVTQLQYRSREASVAELAKRYFFSRGPATLQDFTWWSGLNTTQAKAGIEMNRSLLHHEVHNGQAYWFAAAQHPGESTAANLHLLPAFDEYTVAYKDRTDVLQPHYHSSTGNGIFKPVVVLNGQVTGIWKRTETKQQVQVDVQPFTRLSRQTARAVTTAARKYAAFTRKELAGVETA